MWIQSSNDLLGSSRRECRGFVSSWTNDGDMAYSHHWCLRGPMLPLLPDGGAHVVVMLSEQLVVFMTPNSRVMG